jgi:membrane protease YdiL (CAAX protease family)
VALCWLYERTRSLWPCVFAHVINNSLALLVVT